MKTKSGILILGKREIEALEVLKSHVSQDLDYSAGGTFGDGENCNEKEIKKAKLGLEVIDFVLQITK